MRTVGHMRTWGNTLNAFGYMTSTEAGEILYQQVASLNQESQFLKNPEYQKSSHKDATPINQVLKFLCHEVLSFNQGSRSHFLLSLNSSINISRLKY